MYLEADWFIFSHFKIFVYLIIFLILSYFKYKIIDLSKNKLSLLLYGDNFFFLDGVEHEEHIRKANNELSPAVVLVVTLVLLYYWPL